MTPKPSTPHIPLPTTTPLSHQLLNQEEDDKEGVARDVDKGVTRDKRSKEHDVGN